MEFIVGEDYARMSRTAADIIADRMLESAQMGESCVLGLATGSTPVGTYDYLVQDYEAGKISFADVISFNLDEYVGLSPENDQSYRYFMEKHLFSRVNMNPANVHIPSGVVEDAEQACMEYEEAIWECGGVDLQLLGLGHNGHIGFNEPANSFPVNTHIVDLQQRTIEANSRFFESANEVPRQAYTMGIGTIMRAREILLVASGEDKAEIVQRAFTGPVVPEVPASVLQLHPNVTVVVDEAAGSRL